MRGEPDLPGGGIDSAQYNNDRWFELFIERDTEAGMRAGLPLHRRFERFECAGGCCAPLRFAEQMAKSVQRQGGDAVARGCGMVVAAFAALDELLVIMADEKEAAVYAVFELLKQYRGQLARPDDIGAAQLMLHEFDQRVE